MIGFITTMLVVGLIVDAVGPSWYPAPAACRSR